MSFEIIDLQRELYSDQGLCCAHHLGKALHLAAYI